ncbi:MAG: thiamine pyrophosphate-binding protein [Bdellovibrionales bacterium]
MSSSALVSRLLPTVRKQGISFIAYVPDNAFSGFLSAAKVEQGIQLVNATREEEAIGIACGAYLAGGKPIVVMQSSGLGNSLNALGSLVVPYQIPLVMFVNVRGALGEWNVAQSPLGANTGAVLKAMNVPHVSVTDSEHVTQKVGAAIEFSFSTRQPIGVLFEYPIFGESL